MSVTVSHFWWVVYIMANCKISLSITNDKAPLLAAFKYNTMQTVEILSTFLYFQQEVHWLYNDQLQSIILDDLVTPLAEML